MFAFRSSKVLSTLSAAAVVVLYCSSSLAECTTQTQLTMLSVPDMTIRRDAAIGTEIGSTAVSPTVSSFSCTKVYSYQEIGGKGYGASAKQINGVNIYHLGAATSGIGYAVYVNVCKNYYAVDGSGSTGNTNDRLACATNGTFGEQPIQGSAKLVFYKIGEIKPGKIPTQTVASLILRNNKTDWHYPESYFNTNEFSVKTLGCVLKASSIQVPLGEVGMKELTAPGVTAAERQFSIPLNCDVGTKIKLILSGGSSGVYDSEKGLLNFTDPAATGTAKGAKIQLLNNDVPVKYETPIDVGIQTDEGDFSIPMAARYYRVDESLKAGTANGSAIFTVDYE